MFTSIPEHFMYFLQIWSLYVNLESAMSSPGSVR